MSLDPLNWIAGVLAILGVALLAFSIHSWIKEWRLKKAQAVVLEKYHNFFAEIHALARNIVSHVETAERREEDPLDTIIGFFALTSEVHDHLPVELIDELRSVGLSPEAKSASRYATWVRQMGRDLHGWNRTSPGEAVTPEKVFLGDRHGIHTKTVAYWKEAQASGRLTGLHHDTYHLLQEQAKAFMTGWKIHLAEEMGIKTHHNVAVPA